MGQIMKIEAVIVIPGEPQSQQRHRDGRYGGKYDPSAKAKQSFAVRCLAQWRPDGSPTDKLFEVDASFYCSGNVKDGDNCFKFVADALEGLYWLNDRQIKKHHVHIIDNSEHPRTVLIIGFLTDRVGSET